MLINISFQSNLRQNPSSAGTIDLTPVILLQLAFHPPNCPQSPHFCSSPTQVHRNPSRGPSAQVHKVSPEAISHTGFHMVLQNTKVSHRVRNEVFAPPYMTSTRRQMTFQEDALTTCRFLCEVPTRPAPKTSALHTWL